MEKTGVQKLASVLKVLVTITFICNILALFQLPTLVVSRGEPGVLMDLLRHPVAFWLSYYPDFLFLVAECGIYDWVLYGFLFFCGVCTAVILWQARRVLDTILAGNTFTFENAANMRRAAVCCFLISVAALGRTVWGLCFYRSLMPLLTYNALFVPIFLMAGLLCMVMSALFRQAAELKAENDLTI